MALLLVILIVFIFLITNKLTVEAFHNEPKCKCPQCVLAQSADTYNNIKHDKLQCVKANSGGPIKHRNRFNSWGKDNLAWYLQIPVTGFDYGFYKC